MFRLTIGGVVGIVAAAVGDATVTLNGGDKTVTVKVALSE